jgi:hypothetical protein
MPERIWEFVFENGTTHAEIGPCITPFIIALEWCGFWDGIDFTWREVGVVNG